MNDEAFQDFLDSTYDELESKQNRLEEEFGLGHFDRYDLDPEAELITFSAEGRDTVTARFVPIGTFVPSTGSWMWGWHNDAFSDSLREQAAKLLTLAEITDIAMFEEPTSEVDEEMAWEMTAMSLHVLDGLGVYRVPADDLWYFYALFDLCVAKH